MKLKIDILMLGEKIVVLPYKYEKTESGLILPDKQEEIPTLGEVMALGNNIPKDSGCDMLKIGDSILWYPYAGTWFKYRGQNFLVIRPNDVIGIVKHAPDLVMKLS